MGNPTIHRISGRVVLGLSLFAMALVVGATVLTLLGQLHPTVDGDEGAIAHLFQITIVLIAPSGLAFLATADWREPRKVAQRLAVPAVALVAAFATLFYMEHMR